MKMKERKDDIENREQTVKASQPPLTFVKSFLGSPAPEDGKEAEESSH
jgi:hypothetical protein